MNVRAADGGLPPIVVFGLDGTLFETRPRTLQILFEFADSVENEAPAVAASLRRLEHGMIRRLLRDTLRTEKRDLAKKWSDGELSDDDYHSAVEAVDDKMATLLAEQTRADTLREVNEQNARRAAEAQEKAELAAMAAVAAAAKKAGQVDYGTDKAAAVEFDSLFAAAKMSPANASLTPAQLVEKAHKAVLALRGIAAAPAPAPPAAAPAAPAAPAPRAAPPSIGGLPNAAPAVVNDDLMAQFSNLEGEDAERFLAGLPANQVAKLMRTTDNLGIH